MNKVRLFSFLTSVLCLFSLAAGNTYSVNAVDGNDSFEEAIVPVMGMTYVMNTESGDYDYFKFELNESGTIKFHAKSSLGLLNYMVYRSYKPDTPYGGDLWNFDGAIDKNVENPLNAGTYYIAFGCPESYAQEPGEYTVTFTFETANETFPETGAGTNNDFASANKVNVGDTVRGFTSIDDGCDFYSIEIAEPYRVCWNLKASNQDLKIVFYDSQFNEIYNKSFYWKNGVIDDTVSVRLPAGASYFNVVCSYAPYEFTTSIVPYYDMGDVNMDTKINLYDVIEAAKYIMGMTTFDDEQIALGDMNGNGGIDLYDAIEIAKTIM